MEATTTTDDDAPGKKQTTATPKSNADFRNFLLSNGRNDEEKNFAKNNTTTTKEEKDLPDVGAFPNRKKKKKKANQLQETTTKTRRDENNTHRYRDRAKERREMEEEDQDDDDGDEGRRADNQRDKSNTFATTTRGGVFEHAFEDEDRLTTKTTTINTNSKRLMDIEKSKYMGGDEKTTHKVKGLDFALLRKKREELFEMKKENIEEGDDDDDEEEVVVEDEDDANNNNPSSSGYSSLYDAKSNSGASSFLNRNRAKAKQRRADEADENPTALGRFVPVRRQQSNARSDENDRDGNETSSGYRGRTESATKRVCEDFKRRGKDFTSGGKGNT